MINVKTVFYQCSRAIWQWGFILFLMKQLMIFHYLIVISFFSLTPNFLNTWYFSLSSILCDNSLSAKIAAQEIKNTIPIYNPIKIIHSIFGIQVCNLMLQTFNQSNTFEVIITTSIFLVIIYGGYFIITYLCSKSIIKDNFQ